MSSSSTTFPSSEAAQTSRSAAFLPLVVLLFAASGCCALIYEVTWYQALQLVIGSTSVSLGVLLATFMGGLCIGSLALPRIRTTLHPLAVYAVIEAGIGVFALLTQLLLPLLNRIYIAGAESGLPGMLLRGLVAAACMLVPTILMGASLPAVVRWIKASREGMEWWGFLYAGNTAGAIAGCLIAGFYLLRLFNITTAVLVAAALNFLIAIASYVLSRSVPRSVAAETPSEKVGRVTEESPGSRWPIYLTIALSGATGLGAEVVWTRMLGMLLLATVYVFAIILAVFLFGLAIGSTAGSALLKRVKPQPALGWCQIFIALGMIWTAWCITRSLPYWNDDVLLTKDSWHMYTLELKRCLFAILPSTLFWGASFPFACAAAARRDEDPAHTAGAVYAANTVGGIVGALLVSLWMIPAIGSQNTQRVLLVAAALSAIVALMATARKQWIGAVAAIATACMAIFISPVPGELIAYGRRMGINENLSQILYVKEGRNSSVAISRWSNGAVYVNVNGHVEATTEIFDMKLQRMVGHLPGLLHPNPKSVLGIGFGAGVSAGTFTRYPGIEHITVCEIEPVIPPASTAYFGDQDYWVALNPKTRIVFDDARHFLMTTSNKYDIIASDPLDVFVKGTAALYSKEYFEAVKRHLNPGGMFTLYVPLYETDEPTIKSELKTFFEAFPDGTVWANTRDGLGYDMVFMGQAGKLKVDLNKADARYNLPEHEPVRQSLRDIGINSIYDLFSTYTGSATDLEPYVRGAEINTDGDLRLSYLAGWGINSSLEDYLYRQMLRYRGKSSEVFTGAPERLSALRGAIANAR